MNDSLINPDFASDVHYFDKPISSDELISKIERESPFFQNFFGKKGFVASTEYNFITCANFHESKNCALNAKKYPAIKKSDEEILMAKKNLKCVEEYLQRRMRKDIKLIFVFFNSSKCALCDASKWSDIGFQNAVEDWFS